MKLSRCLNRPITALLILVLGSAVADAQSLRTKSVDVRVSSVAGGSLYLDRGRAAGLEAGDQVLLTVPGRGIVTLTIQFVSRTSARCAIPPVGFPIEGGTRGVVSVPVDRFAAPNSSTTSPLNDLTQPIPEHPPWSDPLGAFDESAPLLAPAMPRKPRESTSRIRGRLFSQYLHNVDFQYWRNQYSRSFVGADIWYENPFQRGGGIHFEGQLATRGFGLYDEGSDFTLEAWPTQLSYYWGGTEDQPFRIEAGRFFHHEFSELGLIDGTEIAYRNQRGDRMGISLGFLPEPFPNLQTGRDFQASAFYRAVLDEAETLTAGIAFQKTWHDGIPDRDLVVANFDYTPTDKLSLYGSLWADFYGSNDRLKSSVVELTEAHINSVYRIDSKTGVGASITYLRWPQLRRNEFRPVLDDFIQRNRLFRGGVYGWRELTDRIRLDARIDQWFDQDDNGTAWDLGVTFQDWPDSQSELILGIYNTDGLYSSGLGGRITMLRYFSKGYVSLGYDAGGFQYAPIRTDFLQHAIRLALNATLSETISASLTGSYAFGNRQDALSLGLFLQKRF